ncbi:hypothetical protein H6F46_01970 [Limnothrix sp. FACHB-1083]|uniref:hypothetical protein n=1 Tax=Limnothrix sp. FACHB-1088 TaxID=2692816 RepID=UPI001681005D|nr:hypothetical protein [Limnothrix sp. FACHB-1088]MBD2159454.1 hypothetical protein [Limnothrix sp. FACHB-1083]
MVSIDSRNCAAKNRDVTVSEPDKSTVPGFSSEIRPYNRKSIQQSITPIITTSLDQSNSTLAGINFVRIC